MGENRVVLVTGSSRGIGKSIALQFLENGDSVVFTYRRDGKNIEELKNMLHEKEDRSMLVRCDVSQSENVKQLFQGIKKRWGRIDVLVNNAGITRDGWLMMLGDKNWEDTIDTNLKGSFLCMREAAKMMKSNKQGVIINISSTSGFKGQPGQINYSASKGGILAMTKVAARELAPYGIRVNAVAPGFIETGMVLAMPKKQLEEQINFIPLNRIGNPEEVANVVSFLASDKASYVTGECIVVDGGLTV